MKTLTTEQAESTDKEVFISAYSVPSVVKNMIMVIIK